MELVPRVERYRIWHASCEESCDWAKIHTERPSHAEEPNKLDENDEKPNVAAALLTAMLGMKLGGV